MTNRYYEPNAEFSASALRAEVERLKAEQENMVGHIRSFEGRLWRAKRWARAWKAKAKDLRPWAHDYKVHLSRAATAEIEASEIRARHDALVKLAKELVEECRPHIDFEKLWAVADKMRAALAADGEG